MHIPLQKILACFVALRPPNLRRIPPSGFR